MTYEEQFAFKDLCRGWKWQAFGCGLYIGARFYGVRVGRRLSFWRRR